jgi:hypothetical protein
MDPRTLFFSLAGNHALARGFALAMLETARAAYPDADDLYGKVNVATETFETIDTISIEVIDVWLDCAGSDAWLSVHAALDAGQVVFRNLESGGIPTKLIGTIDGEDRLEFFADDEDKLWLVIAAC